MKASPVSSCGLGANKTSWYTSVSRPAVSYVLCFIVADSGKPPLGQERACSTVKWVAQAQTRGIRDGIHPYLSASASVEVPLCRQNPHSSMGI